MAKIRPPFLVLRNREVVEVNPRKEIDVGLRKFDGYSVIREYDGESGDPRAQSPAAILGEKGSKHNTGVRHPW